MARRRPEDELDQTTYLLCQADTADGLVAVVNRMLRRGWRLQGGACVMATPYVGVASDVTFYQAVVYDPDD